MRRQHIFPLTRIVPGDASCNRPLQERLSLFPKLVGCTIATNAAPLEGLGADDRRSNSGIRCSDRSIFSNCRAQPLPKFLDLHRGYSSRAPIHANIGPICRSCAPQTFEHAQILNLNDLRADCKMEYWALRDFLVGKRNHRSRRPGRS